MEIKTQKDYKNLIESLRALSAGSDFIAFSKKIIKTEKEIIGVRTNEIRKLASQISKCEHDALFDFGDNSTYEEVLIKGMVLAKEKDFSAVKSRLNSLLDVFDSWAEVDMICSSLAFVKGNKQQVKSYFYELVKSEKQFVCRFGIVGLMKYFLSENELDGTLSLLNEIGNNDYYSEMALAWLISEVLIKYPQNAIENIKKIEKNCNFSKFSINKGIQKATESYRIDENLKTQLRELKQK